MSLSTLFNTQTHTQYADMVEHNVTKLLQKLEHDLNVLKDRAANKPRWPLFAARTKGAYQKDDGSLLYMLFTMKHDSETRHMVRQEIQRAIDSSKGLIALHAFCAQQNIDLCIKPYIDNDVDYTAYGFKIHTREQYKASPIQLAHQPVKTPSAKDQLMAHIQQFDEAAAKKLLEHLTNPPQLSPTPVESNRGNGALTQNVILRAPQLPARSPNATT